MSAQKALQGFEMETEELLGGTEQKSISLTRGYQYALQANQQIFTYLAKGAPGRNGREKYSTLMRGH